MPVPVLPAVYLPSVEYFSCLTGRSEIMIENDEHYHRQSYRNRCCIYGPNGIQKLVVPVVHPGKDHRNIREIRIDNASRWQQIHWRSITAAYNKSPFFEYYAPDFEAFFQQPQQWLFELNMELLAVCLKLLRQQTTIKFTGEYQIEYPADIDFRDKLLEKSTRHPERFPRYPQVFEPIHSFIPNLSIIDLLFNRGNDAVSYLRSVQS